MNKAAIISILLLMLGVSCARAAELIGIKTDTGFLLLNQDPGNYFSIEIQASEMPALGHFIVRKNQLQITSTLVSDFLDDPTAVNDARDVLEKKAESKKVYIKKKVSHAPPPQKSHYENVPLSWRAKGSKPNFRFCPPLHTQT